MTKETDEELIELHKAWIRELTHVLAHGTFTCGTPVRKPREYYQEILETSQRILQEM